MPYTAQTFSTRAAVESFIADLAVGAGDEIQQKIQERETSISELIPGFILLKGCEQGTQHHSEGNALIHTAKVFSEMARLTLGDTSGDRYVLLIAALVHDIEKPSTRSQDGDRVTFFGHAEIAAKRTNEFAQTFYLSQAESERLDFVVRNHMSAHLMKTFGDKARFQLYNSPHFTSLMVLQEADALSSWQSADGLKHGEVLKDFFASDRSSLMERETSAALQKLLYDGATEALKELGVSPGPYFGQMRKALQNATPTEAPHTREEARDWARKYYAAHPPS